MVPSVPDRWPVPYLAVAVGLALLLNPLYLPGPHLGDDVYRYEAHAVEYDAEDGLVTTNAATGERSDLSNVDDAIICEGLAVSRECAFEYAVFSGEVDVEVAPVGAENYRFVYLDGAFYRPTYAGRRGDTSNATHERVPAHEALDAVSTWVDDASPALQAVVDEGERLTFRELDGTGELLRATDGYYVVVQEDVKEYYGGGPSCASGGDGFCARADRMRLVASLPHAVGVVVGALLVRGGSAALRGDRGGGRRRPQQ